MVNNRFSHSKKIIFRLEIVLPARFIDYLFLGRSGHSVFPIDMGGGKDFPILSSESDFKSGSIAYCRCLPTEEAPQKVAKNTGFWKSGKRVGPKLHHHIS